MKDKDELEIWYRTAGKALPPRPIKVEVPGWGGSAEMRKRNGSEPQPWHCPPFTEAATYGLELIYQYETECHVLNDGSDLRIEWDYQKEPGGVIGYDEFTLVAPKPSRSYIFATSVDLQAPPGYVLRTEPHPRFYTDASGTAPLAIAGHVQSEWWAKKLFVVFKAPGPGQRHVFRKGEPYVQILFVPQKMALRTMKMSPEQEASRDRLEAGIKAAKSYIAKNAWFNPAGNEFNDHYRTLARAFAQGGEAAVADAVAKAVEYHGGVAPPGRSVAEYLALAERYQAEGKYIEAKATLIQARRVEPGNPEVLLRLAAVAHAIGLAELALSLAQQAADLNPRSPANLRNVGVVLKRLNRLSHAEGALRASLALAPEDPQTWMQLGLTLSQQGRSEEALQACEAALRHNPQQPAVHVAMGVILARDGRHREARACYQRALAIDPQFPPARRRLADLPAEAPQE